MTSASKPRVVVHGHFYQPPRENPWTGRVERQASASPDHDWNTRIARECYLPNVKLGNLRHMSFNFGPTLLAWADSALPELPEAVAAADAEAVKLTGHGSALAQVFGHPIAPLLTERDRRTQVRWGIADFERRYGRRPVGMWLPECAVNTATLRTLREEGIRFTILAATQALRYRDTLDGSVVDTGALDTGTSWVEVGAEGIDPSRRARADLGGGASIEIFFYNGPVSQEVSFGGTLVKSDHLVGALRRAALAAGDGGVVLVATDGETFGHHKKGGEKSLAGAISTLTNAPDLDLSTPEAILAEGPASRVVEVRENSAWSCSHGLGRWTLNCGCRMGATDQEWRAPLREALDWLTVKLHDVFEREGAEVLRDPWQARDLSGGLPSAPLSRQAHFLEALVDRDNVRARRKALRLLEMERQVLFTHTSCGWFFDDLGGLEPVQNLRCAARALDLSGARAELEPEFVKILSSARSNEPALGTGADIYERQVLSAAVDPPRAVAEAALRWLAAGGDGDARIIHGGYVIDRVTVSLTRSKRRALVLGTASVADIYDGPPEVLPFAAFDLGDGERVAFAGERTESSTSSSDAEAEARAAFVERRIPELLESLTRRYPARRLHGNDAAEAEPGP